MEESFSQRHPRLANALFLCIVALLMLAVAALTITLSSSPPEFSATVASFDGIGRSTGGASPTFRLALRVKNGNVWRHCFKPRGAAVEYDGVPIARAQDLSEFCVPARSVVEVPVVATSEGLGLPEKLYEGVQSRRHKQERVPLAMRLTLDELHVVLGPGWPMLLQCTAMLDGRPDLPSRCLLFIMVEQGLH
ncbi:hypothetical protein BRADI_2g51274v3 [Brachypodium distachyon]|uniref:Late embryogenesis abundant protein LEA-2 subgroup domain-containing protein n=1 Tax=Brachypodium distachyon TaxID=15368 RepID=A0A0Q3IWH9_BRADI|nr:hypothetical protein BRADI_2g51274v3 [Brachypodium distachyon]